MKLRWEYEGSMCSHCAGKVETMLRQEELISDVRIDTIQKRIMIETSKEIAFEQQQQWRKQIVAIEEIEWRQPLQPPITNKFPWLLVVSVVVVAVSYFEVFSGWWGYVILGTLYLINGYPIIKSAVKGIGQGQLFDENLLMSLATLGAIAIGELPEALGVMVFYRLGEYYQDKAVAKARLSVAAMFDEDVLQVTKLEAGQVIEVQIEEVEVGDQLVIKPNSKLLFDGVIVEGEGYLDTSLMSGESQLMDVQVGSKVISGSINQDQSLVMQVSEVYDHSTYQRLRQLLEVASGQKTQAEAFITKFARWYTPLVVGLAIVTMVINWILTKNVDSAIYRGLIFLVISCPCALVLAIPLTYFLAIGAAGKRGMMVKGSQFMESIQQIDTIIFDKTGTLTNGEFAISEIVTELDHEQFLQQCALLESQIHHPIARCVVKAYQGTLDVSRVSNVSEVLGKGCSGTVDGQWLALGNERLVAHYGLVVPAVHPLNALYLFNQTTILGYLVVEDQVKPMMKELLAKLPGQHVMLSGDKQQVVDQVAAQLGITEAVGELLPEAKAQYLQALLTQGKRVMVVGDGSNDALMLAQAEVGVVMRRGSDLALEVGDIILMDGDPQRLVDLFSLALATRNLFVHNVVFILLAKALFMLLGFLGFTSMWLAIIGDVGVALLAILNATRLK
jgi:Zn2+/Cd2+-exporting ATPase